MKKLLFIFLFSLPFVCLAVPTSTLVQTLIITGLKNAPCLTTGAGGLVTSTACGTSTFTTTTINNVQALQFTLQGTAGQINVTTVGSTSTWSLANLNISQWVNDVGYITATGSSGSFTTTSINGLSDTSYTFTTSTSGASWTLTTSSAPSTITINFPSKIYSLNSAPATTGTLAVMSKDGTFHFIAPGPDGTDLMASSSAPNGLQWIYALDNVSVGGTIYNTTTLAFATSGPALQITASGNTLTWTLPTSTASVTGVLTGTDWTTFNSKITTSSLSVAGGLLSYNNTSGVFGDTGKFVSSTQGTAPIFVSGATGAVTISLGLNAVSSTRAINAGSGLLGGGDLSADRTIYWNATQATSTIYTVTSSNIFATGTVSSTLAFHVTATTTQLGFSGDTTFFKSAFRDLSFNVLNSSTTNANGASSTIQKLFYLPILVVQLDCSTDGEGIQIGMDNRVSSTPQTYGITMVTSTFCYSTGNSTTTFASSTVQALRVLNFGITKFATSSNSTTTLRVHLKYEYQ